MELVTRFNTEKNNLLNVYGVSINEEMSESETVEVSLGNCTGIHWEYI